MANDSPRARDDEARRVWSGVMAALHDRFGAAAVSEYIALRDEMYPAVDPATGAAACARGIRGLVDASLPNPGVDDLRAGIDARSRDCELGLSIGVGFLKRLGRAHLAPVIEAIEGFVGPRLAHGAEQAGWDAPVTAPEPEAGALYFLLAVLEALVAEPDAEAWIDAWRAGP